MLLIEQESAPEPVPEPGADQNWTASATLLTTEISATTNKSAHQKP